MLLLQSISLVQFRNYASRRFEFPEKIVAICGPNGAGKTNLLDAIYYCCFTKSYFAAGDGQLVFQGSSGFRLEAGFLRNEKKETLVCILRENGKKECQLNGEAYSRLSRHIGHYPCVIIAPDDTEVIMGGSEVRRRFLDSLFSQLNATYLEHLLRYNKVLQNRNAFLKQGPPKSDDEELLDAYDRQLIVFGREIHRLRKLFLESLIPLTYSFYRRIAGTDEPFSIRYESQLLEHSFESLLADRRSRDRLLQRSTAGIHRDDLGLWFDGKPFKNLASQGQRKSLLFALKLAAFEMLKNEKGFPPLLLLDDVFEKLDEQRMQRLLDWVCVQNQGQVFITDTHCDRVKKHFRELAVPFYLLGLGETEK